MSDKTFYKVFQPNGYKSDGFMIALETVKRCDDWSKLFVRASFSPQGSARLLLSLGSDHLNTIKSAPVDQNDDEDDDDDDVWDEWLGDGNDDDVDHLRPCLPGRLGLSSHCSLQLNRQSHVLAKQILFSLVTG